MHCTIPCMWHRQMQSVTYGRTKWSLCDAFLCGHHQNLVQFQYTVKAAIFSLKSNKNNTAHIAKVRIKQIITWRDFSTRHRWSKRTGVLWRRATHVGRITHPRVLPEPWIHPLFLALHPLLPWHQRSLSEVSRLVGNSGIRLPSWVSGGDLLPCSFLYLLPLLQLLLSFLFLLSLLPLDLELALLLLFLSGH